MKSASVLIDAVPGLGLAAVIGALAWCLTNGLGMPGASPLIVAIILGMAYRAWFGIPRRANAGLSYAMRQGLRIAIALLGFRLTLGQLAAIGSHGGMIAVLALLGTFAFTHWFGHTIGVDRKLVQLIAAGSSICGASAIIGANSLTGAGKEDVSYAVGAITVMGLLLMLLTPLLASYLPLSSQEYGLWVGSSIHEVAQVVAAGFQRGGVAGETATVAKLTRVLMLAPSLLLAWYWSRRQITQNSTVLAVPIPWFAVAFVAATILNSVDIIPHWGRDGLLTIAAALLTLGLTAVGLETDMRNLVARGVRPLILAAAAALFISLFSLALITVGKCIVRHINPHILVRDTAGCVT